MSRSQTKPLGSKAKEIVFNVSDHFLKDGGSLYLEKTSEATGVSRSTVVRIRREHRQTGILASPKRSKRGAYKPVDDFDLSVIRNTITGFDTVRKQLPTLRALYTFLRDDIQFPGSLQTLRKIMKQMGYRWKRTKDNRKVLMERPNVVTQRLAFYLKKKEFEDRGLQLAYIDETWMDMAYAMKKCWQGENTPGVMPPCNRGQRIIVVHAGCRNGFIPGALLTYKARSTSGDYHSEMDGDNFTKWLEEKLIPNLNQPSAIVMDNASYHSMKADKFPTSSTKKADIQSWLLDHKIPFTAEMLRPQLLELARVNRPPPQYTIDRLLQYHRHEVLRLPPYHPDFNAIELISSQVKSIARQRNTTFRLDDILKTTNDAFGFIDTGRWSKACDHVDRHIEQSKHNDHFVDEHIDSLVIDLRDDSSTESDTASSSDEL